MKDDSFDFIKDATLRRKILNAIDFSSTLWLLVEKMPEKNREELYRTMMLYAASVIEAILNYYISQAGIIFEEEKYTNPYILPNVFQNSKDQVVLAIKKKTQRVEPDFVKMIERSEAFLGKTLSRRIDHIRETRNTYHLLKVRKKITEQDVKKANEVLLLLVKKVQKNLQDHEKSK